MRLWRRVSPEERFAGQVLDAVRATGRVAKASYDREAFAVRFQREAEGDSGWIYLHNTFRETMGARRSERAEKIRRLVAAVVDTSPMDSDWTAARPLLRPVLRGVAFGQGAPEAGLAMMSRPALPYLVELVVIDQPTSMAYVPAERAATWGVTPDEVFRAARANLAPNALAVAQGERRDQPAVIRFVDSGDSYFTSMLLVDGFLASLAPLVGGTPVAFIPDKDALVVMSDDDPGGLTSTFEVIESEYREAVRQLSPMGYTVDGAGRVVPYRAAEPGPLAKRLHRAAILLAAAEYGGQKEALEARHERDGVDVFVGSVMALEGPDGSTFSVAVWVDECDMLLPEADFVYFQSPDREGFAVPWPIVMAETSLTAEPGLAPARYRVAAWPDAPVLERLEAEAVAL